MKKKISIAFAVDRPTVVEGEVVTLNWSCPEGATVKLTLDNGYKATTFDVSPAESKKFRLNRTKGKTHFTLTTTLDGMIETKSLAVRVKKMKATKAHVVDDHGNRVKPLVKVKEWWRQLRARTRYTWQTFSEKKQFAYKILGFIMLIMLLGLIAPKLAPLGSFLLVAYLMWNIIRR